MLLLMTMLMSQVLNLNLMNQLNLLMENMDLFNDLFIFMESLIIIMLMLYIFSFINNNLPLWNSENLFNLCMMLLYMILISYILIIITYKLGLFDDTMYLGSSYFYNMSDNFTAVSMGVKMFKSEQFNFKFLRGLITNPYSASHVSCNPYYNDSDMFNTKHHSSHWPSDSYQGFINILEKSSTFMLKDFIKLHNFYYYYDKPNFKNNIF